MDLNQKVELVFRSGERLKRLISIPSERRNAAWWATLEKEALVSLRRSFEALTHILTRKT